MTFAFLISTANIQFIISVIIMMRALYYCSLKMSRRQEREKGQTLKRELILIHADHRDDFHRAAKVVLVFDL